MKKIIVIGALLFATVSYNNVAAQKKSTGDKIETGAKKTGHAIKKGGKAVGHKSAEVASKGTSKVADKTLKDQVGPNDEKVYVTSDNRYYWIDDKGRRHYIAKSALRSRHFDQ